METCVVARVQPRQLAFALPHAESLTFERTGHIGLVTRPAAFADRVATFVARSERADQSRPGRRVAG